MRFFGVLRRIRRKIFLIVDDAGVQLGLGPLCRGELSKYVTLRQARTHSGDV
jgi:hypothetical protein